MWSQILNYKMDMDDLGTEQLCDTPISRTRRSYVSMGVSAGTVRDAIVRYVAMVTAVLVVIVLIVAFVQLSYARFQGTCPVCTCENDPGTAHAKISNLTVAPPTTRATTKITTPVTTTTTPRPTTTTTTPRPTTTTHPTTTQFQCPPALPLTFASSCYSVIRPVMSQTDAANFCRQLFPAAHLIDVNSQAEQQQITTWGRQRNMIDLWTCASRLGPNNNDFVWSNTNSSLVYTYWNRGEPNNKPVGENCIHVMVQSGGRWNDRDCDHERSSVCEYP